jgi:hypothetical protein
LFQGRLACVLGLQDPHGRAGVSGTDRSGDEGQRRNPQSEQLVSRFDFSADVSAAEASDVKVEQDTVFSFDDPSGFKLRTY